MAVRMAAADALAVGLAPLQRIKARETPLGLHGVAEPGLGHRADHQRTFVKVDGFQQHLVRAEIEMPVQERDAEAVEPAMAFKNAAQVVEAGGIAGGKVLVHRLHVGKRLPLKRLNDDLRMHEDTFASLGSHNKD